MATHKVRVKMGFGGLNDKDAATLSGNVVTGLPAAIDIKTLPPPVALADLKKAHDDLLVSIEAAAQGGPAATADKNKKRKVVDGMLEKLAHHVQIHCNNDLTTVLSTGFTAISQSSAQSQLAVPQIVSLVNGKAGEIVGKSRSVRNAKAYEMKTATVGANSTIGGWQFYGSFTKARSMPVSGLTPGTTYAFSVRAVGGSTKYSDWSDPVTHMCM